MRVIVTIFCIVLIFFQIEGKAQYKASCTIQCEPYMYSGADSVLNEVRLIVEEIQSPFVIRKVLGVETEEAHNLKKKLDISREKNSGIVDLTFSHESKDSAIAILDRLIKGYLDFHFEQVGSNILNQMKYMDKMEDQTYELMHDAQGEMESFQRMNASSGSMETQKTFFDRRLFRLDSALAAHEVKLKHYEMIKGYLQQDTVGGLIPLEIVPPNDSYLLEIVGEWNRLCTRHRILQDSIYTQQGFAFQRKIFQREVWVYVNESEKIVREKRYKQQDEFYRLLERESKMEEMKRTQKRLSAQFQAAEELFLEQKRRRTRLTKLLANVTASIRILEAPH